MKHSYHIYNFWYNIETLGYKLRQGTSKKLADITSRKGRVCTIAKSQQNYGSTKIPYLPIVILILDLAMRSTVSTIYKNKIN